MHFQRNMFFKRIQVVNVSRRTRIFSLIVISLAMMAITSNFYQADAVFAPASVLPVYILFFILTYMACIIVEYASLWCQRENIFHCARMAVHGLVLLLVVYETGIFYHSDQDIYSHLPHYSVTNALSHIVMVPSGPDDFGI